MNHEINSLKKYYKIQGVLLPNTGKYGAVSWYLSTQAHIHARQYRPLLIGLKPLIFIDLYTYMHENIGRFWLDWNPCYLSTQTQLHAREHRPLLVGLKPLIFINSNTHTCTRTSATPDWTQTLDHPVFNLVNVWMMCSCVYYGRTRAFLLGVSRA